MQKEESRAVLLRHTRLGYAVLLVGLLLCVFLDPRGIFLNHGMSYYGAQGRTMVVFIPTLLLSAALFWRAAQELVKFAPQHVIARGFRWIPVLQIGIALTPFTWSPALYVAHNSIAGVFFFLEIFLAGWLVFAHAGDRLSLSIFVVQVFCGIAVALSMADIWWYLPEEQILYQVLFAALIFRDLPRLRV